MKFVERWAGHPQPATSSTRKSFHWPSCSLTSSLIFSTSESRPSDTVLSRIVNNTVNIDIDNIIVNDIGCSILKAEWSAISFGNWHWVSENLPVSLNVQGQNCGSLKHMWYCNICFACVPTTSSSTRHQLVEDLLVIGQTNNLWECSCCCWLLSVSWYTTWLAVSRCSHWHCDRLKSKSSTVDNPSVSASGQGWWPSQLSWKHSYQPQQAKYGIRVSDAVAADDLTVQEPEFQMLASLAAVCAASAGNKVNSNGHSGLSSEWILPPSVQDWIHAHSQGSPESRPYQWHWHCHWQW